jgi:hypothetical protein
VLANLGNSNSSTESHLAASFGVTGAKAIESAANLARLVKSGQMLTIMPEIFWR